MFAVLLTGAKQYLVREGDEIIVEKLPESVGEKHIFDKVLLKSSDDQTVEVGAPFLSSKVEGTIVKQGKADKIFTVKFKAKKNYRRTKNHRQHLTTVKINTIS